MFGYLTAQIELLEKESEERYKAYYCGLCNSLCSRHGAAAGLTLNYDMCFLVLLLNSLYEPDEDSSQIRCLRHPLEKQNIISGKFTDYAADMNLALARLKCLDNWHDDGSLRDLFVSGALKGSYNRIKELYPRQCSAMEKSISELSEIEKSGVRNPDLAADTFGRLMAELFAFYDDRWAQPLKDFGMSLGRFIYLLDAALDYENDLKSGSYNPFSEMELPEDKRGRYFTALLENTLGEGIAAFEYLPLVENYDILSNILCLGLWAEFTKKYDPKEDTDAGSL